jgi:hypothetical protein
VRRAFNLKASFRKSRALGSPSDGRQETEEMVLVEVMVFSGEDDDSEVVLGQRRVIRR